ncbi:MAG: phosphatidate cytidylyltransferase [Anaerolineae bacterium]
MNTPTIPTSLKQRLLSALVFVPVVVACAWLGHPWITLLAATALTLGAWEFARLGERAGHKVTPALSAALAGLLALERGFFLGRYQAALLALAIIAITIWYVLRAEAPPRSEPWALALLAGIYVGFLGSHLVALRALPNGLAWLALALVTMWISDTGAYFVGSAFGKHKLALHLSPKKTWEGAAGGLITALVSGTLIAWLGGISPVHGFAVGLMIGTICPFGDLAKSILKRQVGVKDSSNLIPGHGGMLDRLDTLLFVAPLVYYYATIVVLHLPLPG